MNAGSARALALAVVLLLAWALVAPFVAGKSYASDLNFLLAVVSATATLAGIGFALYGWFTARELPKIVDQKLDERARRIEETLSSKLYRQQEALQKLIAAYGVRDVDQRIALVKQALDVDPTVYNGSVTLGYAYWAKGDPAAAEECFRRDLQFHPSNYQAMCDLAALYAGQSEWLAALSWMKEAIRVNPGAWEQIERDPRLEPLRIHRREDYDRVIAEARRTAGAGER